MNMMTPEKWNGLVQEGVSIATVEGEARWRWGDLALEAAGPPQSHPGPNGRSEALSKLLDDVAQSCDVTRLELPSQSLVSQYRDAAAYVPRTDREGISVNAARLLGQIYPDRQERGTVIEKLRAAHATGKVTVDAVREGAGRATTRPRPKPKDPASRFVAALEMAHVNLRDAANIAHGTALDDGENEFGFDRVGKLEYELARLRERVSRPAHLRDVDGELAALLGDSA